jgi:hypothetical protein
MRKTLLLIAGLLAGQIPFNLSAQTNVLTTSKPAAAANETAELVKKSLNPVADLTSAPFQNNWDFHIGPNEATKYTLNIQPVIPVSVSSNYNLIVRTIMPINEESPRYNGDTRHGGMGDITQSFFLSPKEPLDGWILGAGPVGLYPTASDPVFGSQEWGAGPTVVALRQECGLTYGVLANHIWSFTGWGGQNVNASYLQPFLGYSTKHYTTLMVNTESTYDWQAHEWTVPLNIMLNQMIKVGKMPVSLQVGYRYYAQRPEYGPDWGLRATITFLFPKL